VLSISWPNRKLREVAEIRVSNVDKKTHSSETPVKLCNYMDVYSNEYITTKVEFMDASATPAEIERFGLRCGDVVITKDSETPDDIGIPTVISDEIDGVVCGYHLALIRPNVDELDSVFLAKQLSTSRIARYFSLQASGSTRYGLPISAIESVEIPMPPKPEQSKIAEILSTVDRAIEQTEGLIAKQQRIKTGLMQDLLTRGIDEHGNLRSEETHEFKDSPLGRIPVEWDCSLLLHFVPSAEYGISTSLGEFGNPVLRMNNFFEGEADISGLKYTDIKVPEKLWLRDGDVLFNRTNSWEHVGRTGIWRSQIENATFASYLVRLNPSLDLLLSELLNIWLNWEPIQIAMRQHATPAVQQVNINPTNLRAIYAAFPCSLNEQREVIKRYTSIKNTIRSIIESLAKLRSLKTALMQDLLTGKVRVTPLLEKKEVQ
jgi:type I restriction enzyme S subunit